MSSKYSIAVGALVLVAGLGVSGYPALAQRGESRGDGHSENRLRFESHRAPERLSGPDNPGKNTKAKQERLERPERIIRNEKPEARGESPVLRSKERPPVAEFRGGRGEGQPDFVNRPPRMGLEVGGKQDMVRDFPSERRRDERSENPNPRIRTWDSRETLQNGKTDPSISGPVIGQYKSRESEKDELRSIEKRPRFIERSGGRDDKSLLQPSAANDGLKMDRAEPEAMKSESQNDSIRRPSIVRGRPEVSQIPSELEKGQREVDSQPDLPELGETEQDRVRPGRPATVIRTDSVRGSSGGGQTAFSETKDGTKPEVHTYGPRLEGLPRFTSSEVRKMNAPPVLIKDKRHDRVLDVRNWQDDNEKIAWRNDPRDRRDDDGDRDGDRRGDRDRDWERDHDRDRYRDRDRNHDHWRHHWDHRRDWRRYHDAIININIRSYYGAPFAYFPAYYYVEPPVPFTVYRSRYYFDLGIVTGPGYYYAPLLPAYGYRYGHRAYYSSPIVYRSYSCSPYVYREYVSYPWYSTFYYSSHSDWGRAVAYAPGFASGLYFSSDGDDYLIRFSFGYGGGIRWGAAPFVYSWYPYGGYDRIEVADTGVYEEYVAPDSYYNEYEFE